jgi:LuxR family maltose regulon positive regulatory protein
MKQDQLILTSKVQIPPQMPDIVARPRLIHKLDRIFDPGVRVALVLAPPGFGKSSLVSEWAHLHQGEVAWFSVEETDNHPFTFWQYFMAAIQSVFPKFLSPVNFNNPELQQSDIHKSIVHMINKMAGVTKNYVIILDDLHHVTNPAILSELKFLVGHLPTAMNMVITSHQEPDWPLSKLRAKGALTEIRVDELEFSTSETCDLLRIMNLPGFSEQDAGTLVDKSEGWVFGIQLAAIAAADNNGLLAFDPLNPLINEYLVSEVFTVLPPDVQDFLMDISILDSLNTALCAFTTGREDAGRLLQQLEQKSLFLLPVDEQHEVYRFHRLFLDLLRARHHQMPADRIRTMHARASEWYEKNGFITAAVDHALKGEDYDRAVALVEQNIFQMMDNSELIRQSELVSELPVSVLQSRPELTIANAWLLAYTGRCEDAEHYLSIAENSLRSVSLKSERRKVKGRILAVQAYIDWLKGDGERTIKSATQALINLDSGDVSNRGITLISLATALESRGLLAESLETYTEAIETCNSGECTHIFILASSAKVRLMLMLGQLQQADLLATATIKKVLEKNPDRQDRYAALGNLYAHRAEVFRFRHNLASALEMADEGVRLGQQWRQADTTITTRGIKAAVLWTLGKREEVFKILDELRPLTALVSTWYLNYLDAYLILLGVDPERLKSTCRWFDLQEDLSESDFNHSEIIHCRARVRMLYENKRYAEALNWLELIQKDAGRTGTRAYYADSLVMQAICHYGLGDKEVARKQLSAALDMITAERAYSIILDKGEAARELLEGLTFDPAHLEIVNVLLELAKAHPDLNHSVIDRSLPASTQSSSILSAREKEILGYLATHKTSTEIAEALIVSANTVRFHIKSIYNKLDVHSRDEAIECARRLRLI